MNKHEWETSRDVEAMLEALRGSPGVSDRKARLFACARARQAWGTPALPGAVLRTLETSERFADGLASVEELRQANASLRSWLPQHPPRVLFTFWALWEKINLDDPSHLFRDLFPPDQQACLLREVFGNPHNPPMLCNNVPPEPLRSRRNWVRRSWVTPAVVEMARHAYDGRDFAGLPHIADALEEAGCAGETVYLCNQQGKHDHHGKAGQVIHGVLHESDPRRPHHHHDAKCQSVTKAHPLLEHLRGPDPHVRGCWVLDLILGKQ